MLVIQSQPVNAMSHSHCLNVAHIARMTCKDVNVRGKREKICDLHLKFPQMCQE